MSRTSRKQFLVRAVALAGLASLAGAPAVHADVVYWDGSSDNLWTTSNNWNTAADGTGASTNPFNNDIIFSTSGSASGLSSNVVNGDIAINSLLIGNGGAGLVTINADASNHVLTLGPGGITVQDSYGLNLFAPLSLSAAQSWINSSTASFDVHGPIDLGANTLTFAGTYSTNVSGVISGTGGIIKDGGDDSHLYLYNHNLFSGSIAVHNGTLNVQSAEALGTGDAVTLGVPGHASFIEFSYEGPTATIDKNIYAYSPIANTIANRGGGLLTLSGTIHNDGVPIIFHDGTLVVSGQVVGTGGGNSELRVYGAVVTLSNPNNAYDGPTSVFGGGTLINGVTNALPTSTTLSVGDGNDAGTYSLNGHDQQLAGLVLDGRVSSTLMVQLRADGTIDHLDIPSITTLGTNRTLEVDLVGGTPNFVVGQSFQIFTNPGSWGGAGGAFTNYILPAGYAWDTSHLGVDGSIMLAVVPEPGAFVLGLLALAPAAWAIRRRRRVLARQAALGPATMAS